MCSMDSAPCTPIHEMYVVSVPMRHPLIQRGALAIITDLESKNTSLYVGVV